MAARLDGHVRVSSNISGLDVDVQQFYKYNIKKLLRF